MQSEVESKAQYDELSNAQLREVVRERPELVDQLGKTWISKANKGQLVYALEANDKGEDMTPETPEKPQAPGPDTRPYFLWKCPVRKREIVMVGSTERVDLHGRHKDRPGRRITIHNGLWIPKDTPEAEEETKFLMEHRDFKAAGNDSFRLATNEERNILQRIMGSNIRQSEWVSRLKRVTDAIGLVHI